MAASETLVFRARAVARTEITPPVLVLAAAIPIVFLHVNYQPSVSFPLGSTHVGVELSDLAVLAVAVAAVWQGLRSGFAPLRGVASLWCVAGLLLVWILVRSESLKHFVTAAKFAEYALLAAALPLLLRRRADWELVAVAAGTIGLLYAAWRRRRLALRDVALCGTVVAVVAAGVFTLRAGDYDQFLRFLHIRRAEHAQRVGVETYAQHTLLAYIGYRIWRAQPVVGAG